ncbi:MAG: hypothetical protein ACLPTF_04840 [Steroidobacteraceae bacterium]
MTGSFTQKQLRATFTLTNSNAVFVGANGAVLGNVLQLSGLRMSAVIEGSGFPSFPNATLRIWGMAQADMNALAVQVVSGGKTGWLPNTVLIEANSGDGWAAVFAGNIRTAGPDYKGIPDVPFVCTSQTKSYDLANPATPTSFPGSASVFDIISVIAAKMGTTAVNHGVTTVTSGATYFPQASAEQLRQVCYHYDIDPVFSPDNRTVTVTPKGQADFSTPFVLSPSSGLIGYPEVQGNGFISVRSLFNPAFQVKSPITIQGCDVVVDATLTSVKTLNSTANGDWLVTAIVNTLEASKPDGLWQSDMVLYPPNVTAVST